MIVKFEIMKEAALKTASTKLASNWPMFFFHGVKTV